MLQHNITGTGPLVYAPVCLQCQKVKGVLIDNKAPTSPGMLQRKKRFLIFLYTVHSSSVFLLEARKVFGASVMLQDKCPYLDKAVLYGAEKFEPGVGGNKK